MRERTSMKKILYTTLFAASFAFAFQAQAAVYDQSSAMEYQQHLVTDTGGGGGGTTVYQPNTNDTLMYNPNTPQIYDREINDSYIVDSGISQATVTATVSSCPSGTTMSSDKCCCVNN